MDGSNSSLVLVSENPFIPVPPAMSTFSFCNLTRFPNQMRPKFKSPADDQDSVSGLKTSVDVNATVVELLLPAVINTFPSLSTCTPSEVRELSKSPIRNQAKLKAGVSEFANPLSFENRWVKDNSITIESMKYIALFIIPQPFFV